MANRKQSGKLFRLFNPNRDNQLDIKKEEDKTPNLKRFFKVLGRRFWKLVSLNLMMFVMVIPFIVMLVLYLGIRQTPTATTPAFSVVYGANLIQKSTEGTLLLDLFGAQLNIPVYSVGSYIGIGVCVLFTLLTFGWQNVGATYILRSMVRGEPVFLFSDYFYAVKRNFKQGFLLGLIDVVVMGLLFFDLVYFWNLVGTSFWLNVGFYAVCAMLLLYYFMRFYLYLMLVTFDLSLKKLFKNALIFATLGVKRNLMAALGMLILVALNLVLMAALAPVNIVLPLILPAFYLLSFCAFCSTYAAYPIIERYMIEPYETPSDEDAESPALAEGTDEA